MTRFYIEPESSTEAGILIDKLTSLATGLDDIRVSTVAGSEGRPIAFFILSTDSDDVAEKLREALARRLGLYNPSVKDFAEDPGEFRFEIRPEYTVGLHPEQAGSVRCSQQIEQPHVA